ncbi:hypothetical protein AB0D32_24055 [Micromonospora sp. NPDC048170]|uniref:hypothetical protein n=1 Tax=Micromonospora sp. NPDC048170 TaxID=3154819 RepID=UPI0033EEF12E
MIGSVSEAGQLTPWLRRWERTVKLRQDVMSSMFDLDGALRAGQWELATHACRALLTHSALLALALRDVYVPAFVRREREWRLAIDALADVAPEHAERAWQLYLTPTRTDAEARAHGSRVLHFVGWCDGSGETALADALRAWADSAHAFRQTCTTLGVPTTADWYLVGPEAQGDWYSEVLAFLDKDKDA